MKRRHKPRRRNPANKRLAGIMRQYGPEVAFLTGEMITGRPDGYFYTDSGFSSLREELKDLHLRPTMSYDEALHSLVNEYIDKGKWYSGGARLDTREWDKLLPWIALQCQRALKGKLAPLTAAQNRAAGLRGVPTKFGQLKRLIGKRDEVRDWVNETRPQLMQLTIPQVLYRQARWHAALLRQERANAEPGKVVMRFDDGWTVQELTTRSQLGAEGKNMGHCVGGLSYFDAVTSGDIQIFSLRDAKGIPRVTLEVEVAFWQSGKGAKKILNRYLRQAKTRGNKTPKKRDMCKKIFQFVDEAELAYGSFGDLWSCLELNPALPELARYID
jgi:hypothetical protein